ncbi:MAG: hypothetical protein OEQ53_07160 [Saprospiraceae bacterium]|nr:hypothetical protein [Saprospiraceae bacterium]
MIDIQLELKSTFQEYQQAQRVARHLSQLTSQIESAYNELDRLQKQLEKEFKDIEKLEKLSVKGLFHTVLGSKDKQIEKERQEYLQASLKFDEAKKSAELMEYEKDILEKKTTDLGGLDAKLKQLIKQREKMLISGNSIVGKQILEILLQIDNQASLKQHLEDSIQVGHQVTDILNKMVRHLRSAKNWGQWDMTGRQRGASYMKHSAIDKARDLSYQAKHLLIRFQDDLRHSYGDRSVDLHIHFDTFTRFTDIFFDNLISDWIVQQKIQNALSNVLTVKDRVTRIMQSLQVDIDQSQEKVSDLENQRRALIIQS